MQLGVLGPTCNGESQQEVRQGRRSKADWADWADLCRMLGLVVEHLKQFFSGMNRNAFVEMTSCCAGEVTLPTTRWSRS